MELLLKTLLVFSVVPVLMSFTVAEELPVGIWGGKHISLEVTKNGGSVEFDCAHGAIEGKVTLDKQGRFSVSGTYVEEHGGPVRQSDKPATHSVLYSGEVKGKKMKLTIRRKDNKKLIGTFNLTHGQEPSIVKCL